MRKFILFDVMNLAFRAKHVVQSDDVSTKIGMAFHIMLNSIRKVYEMHDADHLVLCLEGRSWRKDIYPQYKLQRKAEQLSKPLKEQEEDKLYLQAVSEFISFFTEYTNVTTLQCDVAEADDMIAMWILSHPDDHHVIVSADSDFYQLLADNVEIYNGINEHYIRINGIFDDKMNPARDKKNQLLEPPEPEYFLFKKCIRGDTSDNIFSAYPGVREKGTKNKVGIIQAFEDRHTKGYNWNNFFMQKWQDADGVEQTVKDRYDFNKTLIDLGQQPDDIKQKCLLSILESTNKQPKNNMGIYFMKFCSKWNMDKISKYPQSYLTILKKTYI